MNKKAKLSIMCNGSNVIHWLDKQEYPFKSRFYSTPAGNLHYVDEGSGEVVMFIHGTPTWSFLYRKYVKALAPTHRCVALDHIGFGISDKPKEFAGTPQEHAKNLSALIKHLNLKDITMVVHDFGGPIGLSYAIENPENIKSIVLFNTWLWGTKDDKDAQRVNKILHSWVGNFLYLNTNFSPSFLLKNAFYQKALLTHEIHKQYKKPFPNRASRHGLLNIGKSLIGSSNWYEELWQNANRIESIPALIFWGEKDPFVKRINLNKWERLFKNVTIQTYEAGHFVQEEKAEETIEVLQNWLNH